MDATELRERADAIEASGSEYAAIKAATLRELADELDPPAPPAAEEAPPAEPDAAPQPTPDP